MDAKIRLAMYVFGFATLGSVAPSTTWAEELVDVTFTVPVQIQNIHSDWSKVGVFCDGGKQGFGIKIHGNSNTQIGIIDVSSMARGSINQTVTGTIQLRDTHNIWVCKLLVQKKGSSTFGDISYTEANGSSALQREGQF